MKKRRCSTLFSFLLTHMIPNFSGTNVECDMMYFYIVLAVLAAFALLTLICAIYLCFKMARRRRRYDTIVIRKRVMPGGDVVRTVEEVHPAYSNSSDRGPIIRS